MNNAECNRRMKIGGLDLNGARTGSAALDLEGCAAIGFGVCCLHANTRATPKSLKYSPAM